jgi:hypothetical protein
MSTLGRTQIEVEHWIPLDRPETYDGVIVGTVLGPALPRRLVSSVDGTSRDWAVQRVRVEESRTYPRGAVVETYLNYASRDRSASRPNPDVPVDQRGAMPVGSRVLVVGSSAAHGILNAPDRYEAAASDRYRLPGGDAPALNGLAFFETRGSVASDGDPMWRTLASVAGAIGGTSDANVRRIADFLANLRLPQWKVHPAAPKAEDRLSELFAGAVARERPYRRALIYGALNRLYYVGYADRWNREVLASATDPAAFPEGVPARLPFWEDPVGDARIPKGFQHDVPPSLAHWLAMLKQAKSSTVAAWMLKDTPKPPEGEVRALAGFLDHSDPRLRYAFAKRLAEWYGEEAPAPPRAVVLPDGTRQSEYPGLQESVARWKTRLRLSGRTSS